MVLKLWCCGFCDGGGDNSYKVYTFRGDNASLKRNANNVWDGCEQVTVTEYIHFVVIMHH